MTQFIKMYVTVFIGFLSIKMTQFIKMYVTVLLNEFHKKNIL